MTTTLVLNDETEIHLPTRADLAQWTLERFVKACWPIIEPGVPLIWNWHHDAICAHLEALTRGDTIKELLIVIPPNTLKSRIISAVWNAWAWITNPESRWLVVSANDENVTRDALACRRIIESDWYQETFRPDWELACDQNEKGWFETTRGGHRQSVSINKEFTGRKGDYIVIDDPNDAEGVKQETKRNKVNSTFDDAIWDRARDFGTARRLIVGQRTHTADLIGHVWQKYRWEMLYIPEEFRPHKRCETSIGWADPRTYYGELLRPRQLTRAQVADFKFRNKTKFDTAYNGEPRDRAGKLFKLVNFRYWHREGPYYVLPCSVRGERRFHEREMLHRFGVADGAASASQTADYTVVSSFLVTPEHDILWIGCKRFQAEIPDQPAMLEKVYQDNRLEWVGVEAVAANVALLQSARRTRMNTMKLDPMQKDKKVRATPAIIFTESHRLYLPSPSETSDGCELEDFPIDDVTTEMTAFTGEKGQDEHDDIVDTLSYAVYWLTTFYPEQLPRPNNTVGVGGVKGYDAPKPVPERKPPPLHEGGGGGAFTPVYDPDAG